MSSVGHATWRVGRVVLCRADTVFVSPSLSAALGRVHDEVEKKEAATKYLSAGAWGSSGGRYESIVGGGELGGSSLEGGQRITAGLGARAFEPDPGIAPGGANLPCRGGQVGVDGRQFVVSGGRCRDLNSVGEHRGAIFDIPEYGQRILVLDHPGGGILLCVDVEQVGFDAGQLGVGPGHFVDVRLHFGWDGWSDCGRCLPVAIDGGGGVSRRRRCGLFGLRFGELLDEEIGESDHPHDDERKDPTAWLGIWISTGHRHQNVSGPKAGSLGARQPTLLKVNAPSLTLTEFPCSPSDE